MAGAQVLSATAGATAGAVSAGAEQQRLGVWMPWRARSRVTMGGRAMTVPPLLLVTGIWPVADSGPRPAARERDAAGANRATP